VRRLRRLERFRNLGILKADLGIERILSVLIY
jgi:hypothetical protein